jgi:hypothetical protein
MKQRLLSFFAVLFISTVSAQTFQVDGVNYFVISAANSTVGVNSSASYVGALVVPSTVSNASVNYTVVSILDSAFQNSTTLTSIVIPNTVTEIRNGAFRFCTNLTSVTIPNSVTSIGELSFNACYSLPSVVIPNSVTTIGLGGFAFCTGLTSLTISNSLTSIGQQVFQNCTSLTSVTIPNSVTSIGNTSFGGCANLTSVTIPNSVASIVDNAFQNCTNLTSVKVNWTTPIAITSNVFAGINLGLATLHVPVGTVALYQAAPVWQNFGTIVQPMAATHLNFDGVNDYVQVPAGINLANSSFTVEFMAKRTATNVNNYVLKQGNQVNNDLLHIGFRDNNDFTFAFWYNDLNIPVSNYVADTNWHHWSCVYNNVNGTRQVYQDGVLVASDSGVSPYTGSGAIQIGSFNGATYFYNGGIDDVRIWNIVRTAEQVNGSKNCELQGTETGLVAYYKFNQGIDAADNTVITSLTDATANANNGTLVNFTKTGTTSNFLAGSPVTTGSIIPSVATVTTPLVYTQGATATALTATVGANGTSLVWYTTATGGTGTTAPTPSTATVGSTSYWVSSTNANGCESARTEIVVTVNALATHLNFDGVDDRVELSNESNFDFTSTFSIEAWIRVTSFTQEWQTVISKGAEGPRIHRFGVSDFIAFGTGPANDLVSTVSVNDGNWHHIAATCNNGFKSLYVDGVLQGTQIVGTPLVTNNDNVRIGSQINGYSTLRAFHGDIDEVRIWNKALTASDITNTMNCELQNTETGLVAYYKFNQGTDAADNTAITTLTDASGNANNGTLVNLTKTGTTSNFLAGSPIVTGTNCAVLSNESFEVANNIKIYPNPSNGIFAIETQEDSTVEVFDMIGKKVYSNKVSVGSSTIDLSNYTNGIYLLTVTNQKGNLNTFKLIKQ